MRKKHISTYALLLAGAGSISGAAWAQDSAQPTSPAGPADAVAQPGSPVKRGGIEDIIVTAQRRSERMQDVPISVTTLSSRELAVAGVAKTDALIQITPGLVMNRQLSGAVPYLRGVGNPSTQPGIESPIPVYVDGVYYASAVANIFSFNNVQQVEVLKGPQGTLFGRNATGGLISITTRDPTAESTLEGSIGYGNYDTLQGNLYASGGSDTLAADIAVYGVHQKDGFGTNQVSGDQVNRDREIAVRGKVMWTPSSDDKFTLSADYSRDLTDFGTILQIVQGRGVDGSTKSDRPYDSFNNYPDTVEIDNWGVSGRYRHDFGFATLTSTTAYRHVNDRQSFDQDSTPVPLLNVNVHEVGRTFQQELLLVGSTPRFEWTTGLFYFHANYGYQPLAVRSPILGPLNFDINSAGKTRSYAGFAQGTYRLGEATRITGGVRYTVDYRDILSSQTAQAGSPLPVGTALAAVDARARFPKLTYRIALDHRFSPGILGYVSYDRGFKSGLFATGAVSNTPVRPETLDAIQAGLKTDLFDRTVRFNVSGFYYDYKDIQLTRVDNGSAILLNAAKGRTYGGEIETTYAPRLPTGKLQINTNLSVLHAKYTSFPNAPIFTSSPMGGNAQTTGDLTGARMIRSPRWTFNFGADYSLAVGSGEVQLSGNFYHSGSFVWEPDGRLTQPGYSVVNAQIGYAFGPAQRYRVRLWGKNLADKLYYVFGTENSLGTTANAAPPRTFGAAFDFKF